MTQQTFKLEFNTLSIELTQSLNNTLQFCHTNFKECPDLVRNIIKKLRQGKIAVYKVEQYLIRERKLISCKYLIKLCVKCNKCALILKFMILIKSSGLKITITFLGFNEEISK